MHAQISCPTLLIETRAAAREQSGPLTALRTLYLRPLIWSDPREQCLVWFIVEADTVERATFSLFFFPSGKGNALCLRGSIDMH